MNTFSTTRIGALIVAVSLSGMATDAAAQESPYLDFNHPSVTVDLSVIDDSGYGPAAPGTPGAALSRSNQRKLMVSGARSPASMLHVEPVGGTAAASARMAAVPAPATKHVAPAPAPKKKKKKVMAKVEPVAPVAAPAPAPVVKKKLEVVASAPKKLEAPAPATSAPPPPTVVKAPKVTPSETAAPKVSEQNKQASEQASVPDAGEDAELGLALQVVFANDATRLPTDAKSKLKSLAQKVQSKDGLRLQLMAYAGGDKLSASLARRLSLSRALSVRSFLIENGVRSTRIDVRALGNKTDKKPLNRVDLNITER